MVAGTAGGFLRATLALFPNLLHLLLKGGDVVGDGDGGELVGAVVGHGRMIVQELGFVQVVNQQPPVLYAHDLELATRPQDFLLEVVLAVLHDADATLPLARVHG